jgi:hypothetical protein
VSKLKNNQNLSRGDFPMRGGQRENAGRKKGVPNKVTAEIRAIARKHGPKAVSELAKLMTKGKSEMARIAAARELLDRGFGKSTQPISGDPENPSVFPDKVTITVVEPTIDRPPEETREQWVERRRRELAGSGPKSPAFSNRH